MQEPFWVLESGLKFEIDFRAGYSPGLFLDQRINRRKLYSLGKREDTPQYLLLHLRASAWRQPQAAPPQ